ncbi:MAG: acetate--CoA ligase [Thermoleophilia bacterium]|nr:acetate--CoA ligase [Thermoleophilia bacterium]
MSEAHPETLALIEGLLKEHRTFPPPDELRESAIIRDDSVYREAEDDFEGFWARLADEFLTWYEQPTKRLEWNPPHCTWFEDGVLNVSANCLDRHVEAGRGDRVAYHWVGESPGESRDLTYAELLREVSRLANGLRELGVRRGDRVGIYMGMVPELPVAMLACARIGAPHIVVFGGFSAESLAERLRDSGATVLITQDEGWRKGAKVPLKANADQAVALAPAVRRVVVLRRTGDPVPWEEHDVWWHELVAGVPDTCEPERMGAEDTLFLLHTSGSTAKPKGALHTSAGYLLHAAVTHKWIFDIRDDSIWWCAADVGWVTGHTYIVYGPLANGTTSVLYEGDPAYPDWDRHWQIVERYGVTSYYTAPTLIRSFVKMGEDYPARHDLSSLRVLGTVGEPINPEAWVWYWQVIGGGRCPVVDTWWQTENGGILITPLPGVTTLKPGSATVPFPGISPRIVDEQGNPVERGTGGFLIVEKPWPGMFRTLFGDDERYVRTYFSKYGPSVYVTGDGAKQDEDGYFWLMGRIDDVINVAGHRLSTTEIESTLVEHPAVAEAAATGAYDPDRGQRIVCFVLLKEGFGASEELGEELREFVAGKIGKIARPAAVLFGDDLPKTRSGKIMRRLLKNIAEGDELGDTTTLRDPAIVDDLKRKADHALGRA